MNSAQVDLIVGIDFGMTFSGVAYAFSPGMKIPNKIMDWPDERMDDEGKSDKVPSAICYRVDKTTGKETDVIKAWGFNCLRDRNRKEWFKRYLDENALRGLLKMKDPPFDSIEEVRTYYRDYMTEIYKHVKKILRPKLVSRGKDWSEARIEFLFSLPATFKAPEISVSLEKELRNAGFGYDGKHHKVSMDLTEPQAAAVYTAFNTDTQLCQGDVILTCDAGGGTTDLAILEQHGDEEFANLHELLSVEGINIGSTTVDEAFGKLVRRRIKIAQKSGLVFKKGLEYTMMHSQQFQTWKHTFGKLSEKSFKALPVDIPMDDKTTASSKEARISDGKLMLSHFDFRSLFDPSIKEIVGAIKSHMDKLGEIQQTKRIDYLVLSGGLGSSTYVKKELEKALTGRNAHTSAPTMQILVAQEPYASTSEDDKDKLMNAFRQIAVAKGLVHNRLHKKLSGNSALKSIQARASYGIVCMLAFTEGMDKKSTWKDPHDGSLWVLDAVKWIIKKGEMIDTDDGGQPHELHRNFPKDAKKVWQSRLVICHKAANELPILAQDEDVFHLCTVTTDLSTVNLSECEEMTAKKRFPKLKRARKYFQIRYEVKFILAPTHIRFELWFKEKQYAERNTTPITVQWEDSHSKKPPRTHSEATHDAERWSEGYL